MEDTISSLNYTDNTCEIIHRLRDENKMLSNEIGNYRSYIGQFKDGDKNFKEWKESVLK